MATQFSILAWKIPWTEEPGRLQVQEVTELDTTDCTCTPVCVYACIGGHGDVKAYNNNSLIFFKYLTMCQELVLYSTCIF